MEKQLEEIKKAMFVNWAWAYNPDILTKEDLDWFYNFILKSYVEERTPKKEVPPVVVYDNGQTPPDTANHSALKGGKESKI